MTVDAAAPAISIPPAAASTDNDALFAARAALKLAARQRRDADAQFDHLRQLIDRLERRETSTALGKGPDTQASGPFLKTRAGGR